MKSLFCLLLLALGLASLVFGLYLAWKPMAYVFVGVALVLASSMTAKGINAR